MINVHVTIDGAENVLRLVQSSPAGYKYNTLGNASQHSFPFALHEKKYGYEFRMNNHNYKILSKES